MKNFFYLILILSVITACSSKAIPIGLKSTIKQIDQSLNDTIKYDFKIAPEEIATSKHHFGLGLDIRNEKGLWRRSFIRTYFKLNRINHADRSEERRVGKECRSLCSPEHDTRHVHTHQ